jgi:hypothetical protein
MVKWSGWWYRVQILAASSSLDFDLFFLLSPSRLPRILPLTSEKMSALFQELKLSDGRRIDACKTMLLDWLIAEKQMLQTQQKVFVWGFRAARLWFFALPVCEIVFEMLGIFFEFCFCRVFLS